LAEARLVEARLAEARLVEARLAGAFLVGFLRRIFGMRNPKMIRQIVTQSL